MSLITRGLHLNDSAIITAGLGGGSFVVDAYGVILDIALNALTVVYSSLYSLSGLDVGLGGYTLEDVALATIDEHSSPLQTETIGEWPLKR